MISCTRRVEFDAAHRVMKHESKCKMLHGHRYVVEVTFASSQLDKLGRVIDFGSVKDILGGWIDDNLDHNTILNVLDKKLGDEIFKVTNQAVYYMDKNPTAENLADHLLNDICPVLFSGYEAKCTKIRVFETPNCFADAILP